jgi:hypothetical protein
MNVVRVECERRGEAAGMVAQLLPLSLLGCKGSTQKAGS